MSRRCVLAARVLLAASIVGVVRGQDTKEGGGAKVFPYEYGLRDLDNGLRVLVVDTNLKNLVSLQIPVMVGSRDEIEPGLSGFAHFFEHMMFRGTPNVSGEEFIDFYEEAGAELNAFTRKDYTNYHVTLSSVDQLDQALSNEADRFKNLEFDEEAFKTEAGAILGEYNMFSGANPGSRLWETLLDMSFSAHPYKHDVIGLLDDIKDMPSQYDFAKLFFERFYRPEYTQVIVAGDLDIESTLDLVESRWGDWNPPTIDYVHQVPQDAVRGPVSKHIEWPTTTYPFVAISFRGPTFSDTENDMATIDAATYYAFSSSSDVYKKLVLNEQKAIDIGIIVPDSKDPFLVAIYAVLYSAADIPHAQAELMNTLASLRAEKVHSKRLADTVSFLRYSSASGMDSSANIARMQVHYMQLTKDPMTMDRVQALYGSITVDDVQETANKYFVDESLLVVTLAGPEGPSLGEDDLILSIDSLVEEMENTLTGIEEITTVLLPSDAPLIDFNILLNVGASSDPDGKEGLAKVTAEMITQGGSESMAYEHIQEALFPLAAGISSSVDKEMTSIKGRVHVDNLSRFYDIIGQQILAPAFNEHDFERIKRAQISIIEDSIRDDPALLGSQLLSEIIYGGTAHPYGALNVGLVSSLKSITLDDVKAFYETHYTTTNVQLGLAGGFPPDFTAEIKSDFSRLLPIGTKNSIDVAFPEMRKASRATIVSREIGKTSIKFGHPVTVTLNHPDYIALSLARTHLGSGMKSRLFWELREQRGLTYWAYASFGSGWNAGRQTNLWQVSIAEVDTIESAHFATRCALYEYEKMLTDGLSEEDFEFSRNSLVNSLNQMSATQSKELAIKMDMALYYGIEEDFNIYFKAALESLTADDVNAAIKRHLSSEGLTYVFITSEAGALRDRLADETTSAITYPTEKPDEILAQDAIVQDYKLSITADNIDIVPASEVFEGEVDETGDGDVVDIGQDVADENTENETPEDAPKEATENDGNSAIATAFESSESSSSVTVAGVSLLVLFAEFFLCSSL